MRRLFRWVKSIFIKPKPPTATKVPVLDYQDLTTPFEFENQTMYPPLTINAQVKGGTVDQREFFRSAMSIMRHVVNSDAFQNAVLDFNGYTHTDQDAREIYMNFMSGKDLYETVVDNEMDIEVTIYNKNNSTVGYTYPNTRKQWINWKFVTMNKIEGIATVIANIVHEGCHNLGYRHRGNNRNKYGNWKSVPYIYGDTAKQIAIQMMTNNLDLGDLNHDY